MPWKKYDVQLVGGCKATGWMFQKGDEDDSGDNGGEDSYPGGPDDHALVMYSRHAPVADDEGNLEEPSRGRRRIGVMRYERRELRAAIAEDPEGVQQRIAELQAERAALQRSTKELKQRIAEHQAENTALQKENAALPEIARLRAENAALQQHLDWTKAGIEAYRIMHEESQVPES